MRRIKLQHVFIEEVPRKRLGPDQCFSVGLASRGRNTNQKGKRDYSYMVRHSNPMLCPVGAILLYLAYRTHTVWSKDLKKIFPIHTEDGSICRDWYGLNLFPGHKCTDRECLCKGEKHELSGSTIYRRIEDAQQVAGVYCPSKCLSMRKAAAAACEARGVSKDAIKHLGRWQQSNLEMVYDKKMSVEAACALGDHMIKPYPTFILKRSRAGKEGFEDLAKEVFPGSFDLLRDIQEANTLAAREGPECGDFSLQRLLEFLTEGSYWLLQDLALLLDNLDEQARRCLEWTFPFLRHDKWASYRNLVQQCETSAPAFVQLPPDVSADARLMQFEGEVARLTTKINGLQDLLEAERRGWEAQKREWEARQREWQLKEARYKTQLCEVGNTWAVDNVFREALGAEHHDLTTNMQVVNAMDNDARASIATDTDTRVLTTNTQASPTVDAGPTSASSHGPAALSFQRFRFADPEIRKCDSIRSVWQKYTSEAGGTSFRSVHESDKDAWSAKRNWADNKLFQAWQKWESIIDGVNLYAQALCVVEQQLGISAAEERVVQVLESRQQRLKYNLQRFREQILTKQALGDARLRGLAVLGNEVMQDYQTLC
eukprot:jgi/Botrbrau1/12411/Bobra.0229s0008.2